jgi:hypothetical protein
MENLKMGKKLLTYFEKVGEKGGIHAKVRLAMLTKMSSQMAEVAEDSPENIKLFEEAMKKI